MALFQVLEDGSVVHINKTTISDTDEDGNRFFFHKSVIHSVSKDEYDDEETEEDNAEDVESVLKDEDTPQGPGVDEGLRT